MATIKFFTRTSRAKDEPANIYVRVREGRAIDLTVKSGFMVRPEEWNQTRQEWRDYATIRNREDKNKGLEAIRRCIEDSLPQIPAEDAKGWLEKVIDRHHNPGKYEIRPATLFAFIEDFIKKAETAINPRTGRPVHYRIRRDYIRTFELLKEFAGKKKLDFEDIDLEFYNEWVQFLQGKNFAANTVGKFIKNLKTFLNAATEDGINTNLKYKSHRFVKITVETDAVALNEAELNKLAEVNLSNKPHLERTRDLFLCGCWTGLRFGDLSRVKPENISDGFINVVQSKTGDRVTIPLHPVVSAILEKYNGSLPPAISNQKTNEHLKAIGQMAGLSDTIHQTETKGGIKRTARRQKWQLISTHTARRSFATNLYKSGFPSHSIMKITGHKSESAFVKYLKLSPDEHAKLLQEHWMKQSNHLKVV